MNKHTKTRVAPVIACEPTLEQIEIEIERNLLALGIAPPAAGFVTETVVVYALSKPVVLLIPHSHIPIAAHRL